MRMCTEFCTRRRQHEDTTLLLCINNRPQVSPFARTMQIAHQVTKICKVSKSTPASNGSKSRPINARRSVERHTCSRYQLQENQHGQHHRSRINVTSSQPQSNDTNSGLAKDQPSGSTIPTYLLTQSIKTIYTTS